jgi:hypothetical protein
MNAQRIAVAVTVFNTLILVLVVIALQARPLAQGGTAIVRTNALEIVDSQGRVRASISVMPEDPTVTFEGRVYPETVLFRMSDPSAGPDVKISVNARGGGLVLGGGSAASYVQIGADERSGWVKLVTPDLREQVIRPQSRYRSTRDDPSARLVRHARVP